MPLVSAHAELTLTGKVAVLAQSRESGEPVPAGRLYGLPDLEGDCWVDMAGAAAILKVKPSTITAWLARRGPKRQPLPTPQRILYRLYWRRSALETWGQRR